jgi:hypothetical protein
MLSFQLSDANPVKETATVTNLTLKLPIKMPVETFQWRGTSDHNLSYSIIEIGDDWKFKVTLSSGTDTVPTSWLVHSRFKHFVHSVMFLCKQHWPNG